ncbi:MAG: cyclic nucleotide-binding domain-containing protein [Thermoanaerobaculia bacterium]
MFFDKASTPAEALAKKAVEEFKERLKIEPADVAAALGLADALTTLGRKREAVGLLGRTGTALEKKGKFLEAVATFKRAGQIDPRGDVTSSFLIHLELEKLERMEKALAPPPAAPLPAPDPKVRTKRLAVQQALAGVPFLKDVPPFLLELVVDRIRLLTLTAGETLFVEGSEGTSVLFVIAGELDLTAQGDGDRPVSLGRLGPGDLAGEISFLSAVPRTATLTAIGRVDVLELDRRALEPILKKHRKLADALTFLHRERVLDGVLARSRLFGRLPREERDWVAQRLVPSTVQAGQRIVRQGETDDGLFLLKRGQVRVTTSRNGKEVALALLSPHDFFGDVAALRGTPRGASVTAVTEVELLCLSRPALEQLVERRPDLRAGLEEMQLERFVSTARLLS